MPLAMAFVLLWLDTFPQVLNTNILHQMLDRLGTQHSLRQTQGSLVRVRADMERKDNLADLERRLALHLRGRLPLDDPAALQMLCRRVLCAITASDGLGVHRAMLFRLRSDALEGVCAVGPCHLTEARQYAAVFARQAVTFDQAMRDMSSPDFRHPDRLHGRVVRVCFEASLLGEDVHARLASGKVVVADLHACAQGQAKSFFNAHDVRWALVVPVMADARASAVLICDAVDGDDRSLPNEGEVVTFTRWLSGLFGQAAYVRQWQARQELMALHGIGGRMMTVEASVRALTREELTGDGKEALSDIDLVVGEVRRALRHAADLAGKPLGEPDDVDVGAVVTEFVKKKQAGTKKFSFRTALDSSAPKARCTADSLCGILDELATNAYNFRRTGQAAAEISISLNSLQGSQVKGSDYLDPRALYVRVIVADEGRGIAPAVRERLFRQFLSTGSSGTGLGLAWARDTLRQQHGDIVETGVAGTGACFEILLPAAECARSTM
jgi:two-component sensor histidine kinase